MGWGGGGGGWRVPASLCLTPPPLCRWQHKQFVEVSGSYLKACRAIVHFIKTPQTRLPDALEPLMHASKDHFAEMEADMPEAMLLDDSAASDGAHVH